MLQSPPQPTFDESVETLHRRIGRLDKRQIVAWRQMTPARRLDIAAQAFQFALDVIRARERSSCPDLPPGELNRRVARRMSGTALPER